MTKKDVVRLYHFVPEEFAISNIQNKRLKVSLFEDMNDPFELLAYDCQNANQRESFRLFKEHVNKRTGIICFSKSFSSPLQWAHYADRHKGMCLGFDVAKEYADAVQYIQGRIPWRNVDFNDPVEADSFLRPLMLSKHKSWSYEQEYRAWGGLGKPINGLYFADFSDLITLKQVIVGASSEMSRSAAENLVALNCPGVELFKVRPAFKTFNMVRNRSQKLWE